MSSTLVEPTGRTFGSILPGWSSFATSGMRRSPSIPQPMNWTKASRSLFNDGTSFGRSQSPPGSVQRWSIQSRFQSAFSISMTIGRRFPVGRGQPRRTLPAHHLNGDSNSASVFDQSSHWMMVAESTSEHRRGRFVQLSDHLINGDFALSETVTK